jgi:predicted SprT family Zn-dependent metalloprotease
MDDFWQPDVINDWNDEFSPRKQLSFKPTSHDSIDNDNTLSSPKKSPVKKDKAALAAKKGVLETRHAIADSFLKELDATLTHGQIAALTASTGGVKIIWSKKLVTTAGRAHWRREAMRPTLSLPTSTAGSAAAAMPAMTYSHHASIELAEKVIDDAHRLLNVLAHEFCHLANFMVSGVTTNPHGREFKAWAAKCSRAFGDRGIEVTTKHSYEIEYKYVWTCTKAACALEYKRHSRSIDVRTERCGRCRGVLVQTRPVPRGEGMGEYQAFVKEHMARVRSENPGSPQKEIMGLVGKRYQEYKATRLKESTVRSVGGEVEVAADPVDVLVKKIGFLDLTSP